MSGAPAVPRTAGGKVPESVAVAPGRRRVLLGVLSDTHGLLRPEVLEAFRGVDAILHAGDVGGREILGQLEGVAATVAVRGNVDRAPWAADLPAECLVEVASTRLLLVHDRDLSAVDPAAAGIGAVISGHSHRPGCDRQRGILYLNPGSAGPRRFRLPVTVARLSVEGHQVRGEIVFLEP